MKAVWTWIISAILPLLGKVVPSLAFFAENGWMIGFLIAIVVYPMLMKSESSSLVTEVESKEMTMVA
jgi:NCS1 family nucleobase:cation symporter-1